MMIHASQDFTTVAPQGGGRPKWIHVTVERIALLDEKFVLISEKLRLCSPKLLFQTSAVLN